MSDLYLLFESASGYGLFQNVEAEEIGSELDQVQKAVLDISKFGKIVKLKSFVPFKDAVMALENINDVSEGVVNELLRNFLQTNFPKSKSKIQLGVSEDKLGSAIQDAVSVTCVKNQMTQELLRGVRLHFATFIKEFKDGDLERAQRGLAHSFSRAKVKFNVNKVDNMIIQAISLLDQLDKDLNTFAMRCREWYSMHFPELGKIITDNIQFAKLAKLIKNKSDLTEENLSALEEITSDSAKAQEVLDASKASMGSDISPLDMINVLRFADRVIDLARYRQNLKEYLSNKMNIIAPNLATLIGETVGARLIAQAGSLTNLAKYPASTLQILGAEKALFRALKTKSNTPKYGLIFHSSFIGKANQKNKGRISRYLANKASIASRIDCFGDYTGTEFGAKLKEQVDERLKFFDEGVTPQKNEVAMHSVLEQVKEKQAAAAVASTEGKRKKKKKTKTEEAPAEEAPVAMEEATPAPVEGERKKKKKKKVVEEAPVEEAPVEEAPVVEEAPKRKKKSQKQ